MQRILVANRGEIALRIIQTCKKMNIETIAIYSDADAEMPFVKDATKAVRVGESPVNKSYTRTDLILEIAKTENVDAIHPGYGFLSENADFARQVQEAGITFIGPDAQTIELMGDKIVSRTTMQKAGVPVVPGSSVGVVNEDEACELAKTIGYPVMLKASGGGGGIGMVRCENEQALVKSFSSTKTRAKTYFGSDEVFIEKCIENARHIEVQVFGDRLGNIVHLFERDCSIQRRNQKVIEESPSPFLSESTKEKMFATAVMAAGSVDYVNAGTIEFIVDEEENFYFLEMNTRLQVEHPVTEAVTGLDLVEWQIRVARGERLPLLQADIKQTGYAIEYRLYAEDPVTFFPSPGKIETLDWPNMINARIDSGYESGQNVTPFYDPMIAKCIMFSDSRAEALSVSKKFFQSLKIEGIKTNAPLFLEILKDEDFEKGHYTTSFLAKKQFTIKK
ncbi:acetyl-CoA carboxylase biotin carboxylase subunit [Pseudoneobacillus sp. C159]